MPVNLMLAAPRPNGSITALSGVKFTQFLSEDILVYAGKINTLDDIKQPLTGAGILTGFQDTAFVLNPVYARTVPYSTFGAGFAVLENMEPVFAVSVFDTNNTPTVSGFETFFDNGATILRRRTSRPILTAPVTRAFQERTAAESTRIFALRINLDPLEGLVIVSTPKTGLRCCI